MGVSVAVKDRWIISLTTFLTKERLYSWMNERIT